MGKTVLIRQRDQKCTVSRGNHQAQRNFLFECIDGFCFFFLLFIGRSPYLHVTVTSYFFHRRWNFTRCCTIGNSGKGFLYFLICSWSWIRSLPLTILTRPSRNLRLSASSFVMQFMVTKSWLFMAASTSDQGNQCDNKFPFVTALHFISRDFLRDRSSSASHLPPLVAFSF